MPRTNKKIVLVKFDTDGKFDALLPSTYNIPALSFVGDSFEIIYGRPPKRYDVTIVAFGG